MEQFGFYIFRRCACVGQENRVILFQGKRVHQGLTQAGRPLKGPLKPFSVNSREKFCAELRGITASARPIGEFVGGVRLIKPHPYRDGQFRHIGNGPRVAVAAAFHANGSRLGGNIRVHAGKCLCASCFRCGAQHIRDQVCRLCREGAALGRIGAVDDFSGGIADFADQMRFGSHSLIGQRSIGAQELYGRNAISHGTQRERKILIRIAEGKANLSICSRMAGMPNRSAKSTVATFRERESASRRVTMP